MRTLASVVVFLRSLPPVHNVVPPTQIIFPVKYFMRSAPQPITAPVPEPDVSTAVKQGAYLVTVGGCRDCHTPQTKHGAPIASLDLAGGFILQGPWGTVASANITPDASGIPYYTDALFLQALRTGYVGTRKLSQIMPWSAFRGMTDQDLLAIFAYLKTVPPSSPSRGQLSAAHAVSARRQYAWRRLGQRAGEWNFGRHIELKVGRRIHA
jgi:hypothetical protein